MYYLCRDSRTNGLTMMSISPFILITNVVLVPLSFRKDNSSSCTPYRQKNKNSEKKTFSIFILHVYK